MFTDHITGETAGWRHPLPERLHKPVLGAFLLWLGVNLTVLALGLPWPSALPWLEGGVWLLAATTTLVGLARRLPLQNVVAVALIATGIAFAILWIGALTDIPFGRREFSARLGDRLVGQVPWTLPFLWVTLTVAGRGVARLILRPWRKLTYYGLWVMGLATLLSLTFDFALEPFAFIRGWWRWEALPGTPAWHSAPWVNFLGWTLTTLLIYGFTTPWLLNKQPVKQPTDWHPLLVWCSLLLLLGTVSALAGAWDAVSIIALLGCMSVTAAVRGGNW